MGPSRTVSRGSWKVPTIGESFHPPRSGTAWSAPLPSWGPPATSRPGALGRGDRRGRWLRPGARPDKLRGGPTETRRGGGRGGGPMNGHTIRGCRIDPGRLLPLGVAAGGDDPGEGQHPRGGGGG